MPNKFSVSESYNSVNTLLRSKRKATTRLSNSDGSDGSGSAGLLLGDAIVAEAEEPPGVRLHLREDAHPSKDFQEEDSDADMEESEIDSLEDFSAEEESSLSEADFALDAEDVEDISEEITLEADNEESPAEDDVSIELDAEIYSFEAEEDLYEEEDLEEEDDLEDDEEEDLEEEDEDELEEDSEELLEEEDISEEEFGVETEEQPVSAAEEETFAPADDTAVVADAKDQEDFDSEKQTISQTSEEDAVLELIQKDPALRPDLRKDSFYGAHALGLFGVPKPARVLPRVVPAPELSASVPRLTRLPVSA